MSEERIPHSKNVPGPFYVENGCCMTCMAPHAVAPKLKGFDDVEGHCFVQQQPQTDEEIYRAIRAVRSSEVQCLRYRGHDPEILRRFVEIGEEDACDLATASDATPVLRNHVTFAAGFTNDAWQIGMALKDYILGQNSEDLRHKVNGPTRQGKVVTIDYSWFADKYYTMSIEREFSTDRWLIHHSQNWEAGSVAVSLMLDDWLRSDDRFSDLRWFTADGSNRADNNWQERPY